MPQDGGAVILEEMADKFVERRVFEEHRREQLDGQFLPDPAGKVGQAGGIKADIEKIA
jgi:hypothetical protein